MRKRAFTLVELMIVVAINGVVLGFVVTSFISQLDKARDENVRRGIAAISMAKQSLASAEAMFAPNSPNHPGVFSLMFPGRYYFGEYEDAAHVESRPHPFPIDAVIRRLDLDAFYQMTAGGWVPVVESSEQEKFDLILRYMQVPNDVTSPLDLFRKTDVTGVRVGEFGENVTVFYGE